MAARTTTVDIWLGEFASESRFEAYLKEQYENDALPINQFCADMGAIYYDHDYIEAEYFGRDFVAVDTALAWGSWSASYSEKAHAAYQKRTDIRSVNSTIFLFGAPFEQPQDARREGVALYYLGRFPCVIDGDVE